MATRRAHARPQRPNVHSTPPSQRLLSSHTFTLIASWRGQLLICTVVLVVGAIYFVVREPIRQWRRRQRERISRAFTDELLAVEQSQSTTSMEDKDRAGPSTGTSTALLKSQTARERGREKRKEKKRLLAAETPSPGPSNSVDSFDSSPSLQPVTCTPSHPLERVPSKLQDEAPSSTVDANPAPTERTSVPTVNLESAPSSPAVPPISLPPEPPSPSPQPAAVIASPVSMQAELDVSSDGDDMSDQPVSDLSRPSVSRTTSASYSILPEDLCAPMLGTGKKKKRKSKARSNGMLAELARGPSQPTVRKVTASSDDIASPGSGTSSIAPHTPRRRRLASGLGGITMTPALELLLTNHERTIDSLRAEIGQCKAEESKARDDEVRTREELRRSRATEDRIRADYERTRKARDRAEADSRRLEAELMHFRNRFETLSHMYQAVCHRLRELESHGADPGHSPQPPMLPSLQPSPALPSMPTMVTPHIGFPSPMASPMPPHAMGFMPPCPHPHMYPSPMQAHGFVNFVPSPSPQRRVDHNGNGDLLAGPLTPGHGPSASGSQASSQYQSDLSLHPNGTPSSSATALSELSAAELRRINIASSVLKKKSRVATDPSESGDSQPATTSKPSEVDIAEESIEGLGIKQCEAVPSISASVDSPGSPASLRKPTKQRSTDSISSDASSGPPGRSLLITPSDTGPKTRSPHAVMSPVADGDESFLADDSSGDTPCPPSKDDYFGAVSDEQDASLANGDVEFAPMFASLAHTPEQLQEIARIQSAALKRRARPVS
ncbi:hypothetical protein CC85DRAFT_293093 [Cutaneotrichosporon oleaginosum]|uniref:Uncharacterized protein n=1 Tax=Cutaneotrichosporon oleaginosum TaxID=879819 RepID=A0A0J0XHS3_9TREE|nr:uncharacterized protein CC85DRAFT_293093 [Cutaneotrichosporon oleaginosum]KLT40623.1 hypothetical protein CC85DRAFT_293093 [Cutaneotrichosporon oleaginosum]TXT12433.1 hypothetical protein COLE_02843 [Cutaneotrichosporon oleaginosum]